VSFLAQERDYAGVKLCERVVGYRTKPVNAAFDKQGLLPFFGKRKLAVFSVGDVFKASEALGVPCHACAWPVTLFCLADFVKRIVFIFGQTVVHCGFLYESL
jgi:hypothetical protein